MSSPSRKTRGSLRIASARASRIASRYVYALADESDSGERLDSRLGQSVGRPVARDPVPFGDREDLVGSAVDLLDLGQRALALESALSESIRVVDRASRVGHVVDGVHDAAALELVSVSFFGEHIVRRAGDDPDAQLLERIVVDHATECIRGEDVDVAGVD